MENFKYFIIIIILTWSCDSVNNTSVIKIPSDFDLIYKGKFITDGEAHSKRDSVFNYAHKNDRINVIKKYYAREKRVYSKEKNISFMKEIKEKHNFFLLSSNKYTNIVREGYNENYFYIDYNFIESKTQKRINVLFLNFYKNEYSINLIYDSENLDIFKINSNKILNHMNALSL